MDQQEDDSQFTSVMDLMNALSSRDDFYQTLEAISGPSDSDPDREITSDKDIEAVFRSALAAGKFQVPELSQEAWNSATTSTYRDDQDDTKNSWTYKANLKMGLPPDQIADTRERTLENAGKIAFRVVDNSSNICRACQVILYSFLNWHNLDRPLEVGPDDMRPHHFSFTELAEAANSGCQICRCVYQNVRNEIRDEDYDESKDPRSTWATQRRSSTKEQKDSYTLFIHVISVQGGYGAFPNSLEAFTIVPSEDLDISYFEQRDFADEWANRDEDDDEDDQANDDTEIDNADKEVTTSKETASTLAFQWFVRCRSMHQGRCKTPRRGSGFRPTRLLRFRRGKGKIYVNLHETAPNEAIPTYATLSHRWGGYHVLQLTKDSMESMKRGISFESLPNVFQEAAVFVLDVFGPDVYLWIDSLCIVQGSREDWEKEAAQMGNVYSNSILNIGATAAVGPHGSLYPTNESSARVMAPVEILTEGRPPRSLVYLDFFSSQVDRAPLNQRAWVFQERTLCPRMVHFGTNQIFWECDGLLASESYPMGLPKLLETQPRAFWRRDAVDGNEEKGKIMESAWKDIVGRYMVCQITRETDRLPAMAAIASEFKDIYGSEYLAGLWAHQLPETLLWQAIPGRMTKDKWYYRPTDYIAPSWSWASVTGHLQFQFPAEKDGLVAEVIESKVRTAPNFPLGPVSSGYLIMKGRLTTSYWYLQSPISPFANIMMGGPEGVMAYPDDRDDADMELVGKENVFCFPVAFVADEDGEKFALSGLVLKTTDLRDAEIPESMARYRRVGYFILSCPKAGDDKDQEAIEEVLASEEMTFAIL